MPSAFSCPLLVPCAPTGLRRRLTKKVRPSRDMPLRNRAQNRAGFVYFVQEAELLRIKIGFTTSHPSTRLKALSNASSQHLYFLGFKVGDEKLEKQLHTKFKSLHCRNEWFHPGEELIAFIDALAYGSELERELRKFVLSPGQPRPTNIDTCATSSKPESACSNQTTQHLPPA
jgi:Meiotically up-regulated gene 113